VSSPGFCSIRALLAIGCLAAAAGCGSLDAGRSIDAAPADDAMRSSGHRDSDTVAADASGRGDASALGDPWEAGPPLGARRHDDGDLEVRVSAPHATRIEVALFAAALGETERLRVPLERDGEVHRVRIARSMLEDAGLARGATIFYGLRVFGPNWPFDPGWSPGSELGRIADVDADGNRMNPNKLVLDPYALEVSHDPIGPGHTDGSFFRTDAAHRALDSGPFAPKGIVIDVPPPARPGPERALRDEIIYEVHLRSLTRADEGLETEARGTYEGARARARALRELGVTAIELLPLHETPNDQNELTEDARGDNHWGYSTLSFFAPDRRYARDRSPGGPTRELRATIDAFHDEGLKVYVDVVYNHTSEGGARGGEATILSLRGLDNATFYELGEDAATYVVSNGVGPNVNAVDPVVADLILASLRYWHEQLGVDGFRFDLATVVANGCARRCYRYQREGVLSRIASELGRPEDGGAGVDLIAEPWGVVSGSYRLGELPDGFAEWNDRYRDAIRRDLNRLDSEGVTLRELARRVAGSPDLFAGRALGPAASIDYVTAHDGLTLRDLFSYDRKVNDQPWPWGPSDGGSDSELASRHDGDAARQRRAARTAIALLAMSHGVPMIVGGDEHLRTQRGNNNPYNLDSPAMWLDPEGDALEPEHRAMVGRLFGFRAAHAALRPRRHALGVDGDRDGTPAIALYRDDASVADDGYLDAGDRHFLSWVIEGDELGDEDAAIWIAYQGWSRTIGAHPPPAPEGTRWHLFADTSEAGASFGYAHPPGGEPEVARWPYPIESRSLAVFVARRAR
jgi:isoamylase